jgi:methyl-accepting chemotaxis protein
VEEQNAATAEIERNVHEASESSRRVSRDINSVQETVTGTGRSSDAVLSEATALLDLARNLEREVTGFLQEIRTPSSRPSEEDDAGIYRLAAE